MNGKVRKILIIVELSDIITFDIDFNPFGTDFVGLVRKLMERLNSVVFMGTWQCRSSLMASVDQEFLFLVVTFIADYT